MAFIRLPDGNYGQIEVSSYTPGRTEYQTARFLGGGQERVPVRHHPGRIVFLADPQFGLDTENYEIRLDDEKIIQAEVDRVDTQIVNGIARQIVSALTIP